ncbi:MAG: hypothetical protein ACK53Y_24590 [bacterium]
MKSERGCEKMSSKKYDFTDGIDNNEVDNVVVAAFAVYYHCRGATEALIQHGTI